MRIDRPTDGFKYYRCDVFNPDIIESTGIVLVLSTSWFLVFFVLFTNNGNSVLADNAEITIPSENIFIKSKKLKYNKVQKIYPGNPEAKPN